ncbi:MAG: L-rhamnose/proton symporter RhaT [Verrucomicrobia bacterium]|nr:L-rhamnose/proton symporter RhaT [Verrucomicrobiota bacterium]
MVLVFGLLYNALGALCAASFYIPFKKVQRWSWETYWNVGNTLAYAIAPVITAFITVPDLLSVLRSSPPGSIVYCCVFGFLWGIGNLLWGLSIRYLGLSLGYALTMGYCAAFGTIMPPLFAGKLGALLTTTSGLVTLGSVVVCLVGIAVCGWAGLAKERELSQEQKKESIGEFDFKKGMVVALLCGIMSACFAFGIEAGKPIADQALAVGANANFVNNLVCMLILVGGALSNFVWCVILNLKNRTLKEYYGSRDVSLLSNYLLCALAGAVAYLGFMFYGMCAPKMGKCDFASWSIYMALIIAFSNIWGLLFREWKGSGKRTLMIIFGGIITLIASVGIAGLGAYLAFIGK